jgi:hypothetical protein
MRKLIYLVIVLAIASLAGYLALNKKDNKPQVSLDAPLSISKNSSEFNVSFSKLLQSYYEMQKSLVDWDTAGANRAAKTLEENSDGLQLKELKADSSIVQTAQNLAMSISSEAKGLEGESDIAEKRKDFNMITDELYSLIRTVRYDREMVYHIRCPMAFGDSAEGYWLSRTSEVVNPYLGKKHPTYKNKMIGCGEIVDSLDFSKK